MNASQHREMKTKLEQGGNVKRTTDSGRVGKGRAADGDHEAGNVGGAAR